MPAGQTVAERAAHQHGRGPLTRRRPVLTRVLLAPVEWFFTTMAGSRPLPNSRGTFLVAYHRHHGPAVHLPGGITVRRGDPIAEIHFWNRRIAGREGPDATSITWRFARDMRADLRSLAEAIASRQVAPDAVAVYGATPVASAAARLGFTVLPMRRGLRRNLLSSWQRMVRRAFQPSPRARDITADTAEVWMSRARLIELFGPDRG